PPAGEFRWIHASVVERSGSVKGSEPAAATIATTDDAGPIKQTSGTSAAPAPNSTAASDSGAPPLLPVSKASDASTLPPPNAPATAGKTPATTPAAQPAPAATSQ